MINYRCIEYLLVYRDVNPKIESQWVEEMFILCSHWFRYWCIYWLMCSRQIAIICRERISIVFVLGYRYVGIYSLLYTSCTCSCFILSFSRFITYLLMQILIFCMPQIQKFIEIHTQRFCLFIDWVTERNFYIWTGHLSWLSITHWLYQLKDESRVRPSPTAKGRFRQEG